jgi:CelD/BcsL family acetyltransferase involved in cellulose biosynthesis
MRIVKESDPVVRYMMNGRAITYSLVRIDGKLAAAMCGFLNQDGSWVLPKLAINMDFSRYSPGGILINESIKYIYENQIPITNVDLSRGEERYKYIYGGKQHLNYRFIG